MIVNHNIIHVIITHNLHSRYTKDACMHPIHLFETLTIKQKGIREIVTKQLLHMKRWLLDNKFLSSKAYFHVFGWAHDQRTLSILGTQFVALCIIPHHLVSIDLTLLQ